MSKKFQVIVADCPWSFNDFLKMSDVKRGALANYSTMSISDIKQLPINQYCHPDGTVLALWVPSSLLQEGLDTMNAWGFKHKQTYVWVKTKKKPLQYLMPDLKKSVLNTTWLKKTITQALTGAVQRFTLATTLAFGMGRLFRQTHEICLIGLSDNKIYKNLSNKSQRSVSFAENLKHSAKPEDLQNSLELMFPKANYLELFARRIRPGWVCLGNEVCNGEDIRDSLAKL